MIGQEVVEMPLHVDYFLAPFPFHSIAFTSVHATIVWLLIVALLFHLNEAALAVEPRATILGRLLVGH